MARDPIKLMEERALMDRSLPPPRIKSIHESVQAELDRAVSFGRESPEPSEAAMRAAVYAPHQQHEEPKDKGTRQLAFNDAICEAMRQEMERDATVFLMGEDVGATGGIFGCSKGLFERFGAARVRDAPLSEAVTCGAGVNLSKKVSVNLGYMHAFENTITETSLFNAITYQSKLHEDSYELGLNIIF